MAIRIETPGIPSFTQIPDSFIRTYMPEANGNFVKVYLYILMAGQHPSTAGEVSVSSLADCMECTENDIRRALRYWQRMGLLILSEINGEITSILLAAPVEDAPGIPATPVLIQTIPPIRQTAEAKVTAPGVDSPRLQGQTEDITDNRAYTPKRGTGRDTPTARAQDIPARNIPAKDIPARNISPQDISAQNISSRDIPAQNIPGQDIPAQNISSRDIPTQNIPGQDIPAQNISSRDIPTQHTPGQDIPAQNVPSPDIPSMDARPAAETALPARHTYTPLQAEALQKDVEIDRAVGMVEQLLGSPVSSTHLQLILYFMCDIGFSSELLATLYQTALNKGKKQPKYIEAIGISWAKQGIRTPEEALEESANFSGRYAIVARAFGIQGALRPAERQIVDSWAAYQFSDAIIEEACKRTILSTGDASWEYASTILKDWHDKHVISLSDIAKCDASHKRQKKNSASPKAPPKKNQFQNFPQRTYSAKDFDSLEKQLLRGQKVKA